VRGNERRDVVVFLLCQLRIDAVGVPKRKSLKIQGKSLAHGLISWSMKGRDLAAKLRTAELLSLPVLWFVT
jgi:hypothetical protein